MAIDGERVTEGPTYWLWPDGSFRREQPPDPPGWKPNGPWHVSAGAWARPADFTDPDR